MRGNPLTNSQVHYKVVILPISVIPGWTGSSAVSETGRAAIAGGGGRV